MDTNNSGAPASSESSSLESSESLESNQSQDTSSEQETSANAGSGTLTKAQAKKIKALKLKVDGKELEEVLPFEIDENPEIVDYLTKQLQLSKVSQKRMSEKAQLERELSSFFDALRNNPKEILSNPNLSIDLKKLAAEVIEEDIINSQKSPEQLEKEKLEKELRDAKAQLEKEKEDFKRKEFERLQEQAYEQYDIQMTKALESSDLPKSPAVIKKMADYMLIAIQRGINVTPEDVLPIVREEIQNDIKQMFSLMPEDVVEQMVGKDNFNKIRKKNLAKAKTAPPVPVKTAVKDVGAKADNNKPTGNKKSFRDFFGV